MNPENWILERAFEPEFRVFRKGGAEFRIEYLQRWEAMIKYRLSNSHTHICHDCGEWADICVFMDSCSPNKCWYCHDCCKEN